MIKHHSTFKKKGILIVKPKLPQKYILKDKALIHKKSTKCKKYWVIKIPGFFPDF